MYSYELSSNVQSKRKILLYTQMTYEKKVEEVRKARVLRDEPLQWRRDSLIRVEETNQ